jgi:hypothetical protein
VAASEELIAFVKESLARGVERRRIHDVLVGAGWNAEQVGAALAGFADVDFPVPVPRPQPYESARDAFLYVVLFVTLYVSAFNLASLIFEFINRAFPDPASPIPRQSLLFAIRWSVASLIVAFPVYLFVAWLLGRAIRLDSTKRGSRLRRQLTYVTLFVASCALIGDVTTLVYNLLGGELTTRFVLKVLTVAVIAGTAFGYYLWDLRADDGDLAA